MLENCAIIKEGKEKAIRNRHHWIFSGAIQRLPKNMTDGQFLPVYSAKGDFLGHGSFNRKSKIIGRMISFDETPPLQAIEKNLNAALFWRQSLFQNSNTNAYRLVNGEGDSLSGLIVDKYDDVLVIQISTLAMELQRPFLIEWLIKNINPRTIYEKSLLPSRQEEGLGPVQGVIFGSAVNQVEIQENGLRFNVNIIEGQKTGFFLDQREMRLWIKNLSAGKRVLNCFSYTGGFSVYAASGGAASVDSIDISETAVAMAKQNMQLNGLDTPECQYKTADVFQYLRENSLDYQLVILDPPAFAKRQKDIIPACRGYKDINRLAMQKMPANSLLLTCSCSYHVDAELFQKVIFQACIEAKRKVRIIGSHRMALDHPINICHPESDYLKSLLLYIE